MTSGKTPADPEDMAETLEAIARRIRDTAAPLPVPLPKQPQAAAAGRDVQTPTISLEPAGPWLGEIDLFSDETHVTVTAETRDADAAHVQVSVLHGRLQIGLGQGDTMVRRELALPVPVDEEHAYATFRNGVLDVVLPRKDAPVRRGA